MIHLKIHQMIILLKIHLQILVCSTRILKQETIKLNSLRYDQNKKVKISY